MRVEIDSSCPVVPIYKVNAGETFEAFGHYYIKQDQEEHRGTCLKHGKTRVFEISDHVVPIKLKVVKDDCSH